MELKLPLADAEKCIVLLMRLDYAAALMSNTTLYKDVISNEERLKLRSLWQNDPEFIENFIRASEGDLSEEEREILRGWKGSIREAYFVVKHYSEYAGFASFESKKCYGVVGLTDCIKKLLPYKLPCLVQTTLLPYKGRIIWDGLVSPAPNAIPEKIKYMLEEVCDDAIKNWEMVVELESADQIMVSLMSAEKFCTWFEAKKYPALALHMALEHREESVPFLLELLDDVLDEYETIDVQRHDFVIALYVLSKMREPLAFDYVIEFAQLPSKWAEKLLEDVVNFALARFIVSTYNGDFSVIKKTIEDESLYIWCRGAALDSLLGLIVVGKISRGEVVEYFRTLLRSGLIDDEIFATLLVDGASLLDPNGLSNEIKNAFNKKVVDSFMISEDEFHENCLLSEDELQEKFIDFCNDFAPIEDLDEALDWLYQGDGDDEDEDGFEHEDTVRNEEKIGRNEPCPCESGKKYKRCCL